MTMPVNGRNIIMEVEEVENYALLCGPRVETYHPLDWTGVNKKDPCMIEYIAKKLEAFKRTPLEESLFIAKNWNYCCALSKQKLV